MDSELLKTITSISTDAIKIIGPAAITAFVGFKAGKVQLELKIAEVERNNRFKAHELLFNYYKDWQSHVTMRYDQLVEMFGTISGVIAASKDKEEFPLNTYVLKCFGSYVKSAPYDVDIAIRDFDTLKLEYQLEYEILQEHKRLAASLRRMGDLDQIFRTIADLIEIYGHIHRCANLIVGAQAKMALNPYISGNPNNSL
ncbi:hypothetical protein L4X63_07015 [Geomonas sp. Red32]|uniref:hypothetical protein n=1 Tax=Geomonas sp. Red32 TaxID=2912856 RepID=UPI00202CBB18|nr:hypothetical protein [Geomonas sp. Red32]MCM0081336.1 hypothetical protein [Geomonas sp. Red32]